MTFSRLLSRSFLAAGLLAVVTAAGASGLQVSPIRLTFTPASPAQGLWLTNTGSEVLNAQVRVFHWTQDSGKDELTPTQALLASPPALSLAPGARQLVRVIRTDASASGVSEDAYRVLIDELPPAEQAEQTGIRYVMRHSVPVFVGQSVDAPDAATVAAALQWSLVRDGNGVSLQAHNSGSTHAQVSAATLLQSGNQPVEVSPGLLGYVLPGMTMRWALNVPAARIGTGTQLKARINGKPLDQTFPVGDLPH
ncbi:fimbrial biogenesis chaperone [Novilysobacter antarcticus]|uniref:fimbrial biogenesis chaperone n=1 Tax=Novilysobacter antarcticus TaxID=2862543 RepID=UPI001C99AFBF|nr:molecular chaperone [Lysobacter antarcticus]